MAHVGAERRAHRTGEESWPSVGAVSGACPTAFSAQAKNVLAASLSRVVLSMVSTRVPSASIAL